MSGTTQSVSNTLAVWQSWLRDELRLWNAWLTLPRRPVLLLWAAINIVALVVVCRWLTGGTAHGLNALPALAISLLLTAIVCGCELACRLIPQSPDEPAPHTLAAALHTLALLPLLCLLLTSTRSPFTVTFVMTLTALVAARHPLLQLLADRLPQHPAPPLPPPSVPFRDAQQWFSRNTADGQDRIEGQVTAEFAAGQTLAMVHLTFNPPFSALPELECEPEETDDPATDLRWKVAALYRYGARIEVRRTSAELPLTVTLLVSAVASLARESA